MSLRVAALWRYPVKSMLGEPCAAVEVDNRGVVGDRVFAVRDPEGKLGSGKNTRRFRSIGGLFGFRAQGEGDVEIAFPDGRRMKADDPTIHEALSAALGTPVRLARESDVRHFDADPIHLVTMGSLDWLRSRLPGSRIDERRFRPNIVVEGSDELAWVGRTLRIGGVSLRVSAPTERCRMTTMAQDDLPFDAGVLRSITQETDLQFGVYAEVLSPGRIAVGDAVA
jgi:uncharacterized protein YcbX